LRVSGLEYPRIAVQRHLELSDGVVLKLWIDQSRFQVIVLKPVGQYDNLSAGRRDQQRNDLAFAGRCQKTGAVRVESARSRKRECGFQWCRTLGLFGHAASYSTGSKPKFDLTQLSQLAP
jgi:hypothetical protein